MSPSFQDRVTAVFVTFNSRDLIQGALDALPDDLPVIVVDNASPDSTADLAEAHNSKPVVIRMDQNQGYGQAANRGLAMVKTEFGLLLNVDVIIKAEAISGLLQAADRYPDAAMLSPEIREPDGQLQFGRQPHLSPLFPGHGWSPMEPSGDCCAAYAGGAAMFLRMEAFRAIGGFDENLFLFGDDDDLCLRFTQAGWSLVHVAGISADHGAGQSSSNVLRLTYWKQWHMAWSRLYLEAKHHSPKAAQTMARNQGPKLALKALWYGVTMKQAKAERYRGRRDATRAFLNDVKAQDVRLGQDY